MMSITLRGLVVHELGRTPVEKDDCQCQNWIREVNEGHVPLLDSLKFRGRGLIICRPNVIGCDSPYLSKQAGLESPSNRKE